MTFDEWKEDYGLAYEPNYCEGTEADCLAAFKAGAASRDVDIALLEAKLEVSDTGWDGIASRDETIRLLENSRSKLREQVAMLRIALFVIQDNSDDIGVIERAIEALEKTEPK